MMHEKALKGMGERLCRPTSPNSDNRLERDWDDWIEIALFSYHVSPQESTGESPSYLLYGRELSLPIDVSLQLPQRRYVPDLEDYKLDLAFRLQNAWEIADKCIKEVQLKQKNIMTKKFTCHPLIKQVILYFCISQQ